MKRLVRRKKFDKDHKKYVRHSPKIQNVLKAVVTMLVNDDELPPKYRDHILIGNWAGHRECHIRPDVLLIYRNDENALELVRLGSHAELFD